MDTNIKVSVLMPVYNGEKYLKGAIDSVFSQTFNDFELIIINDGSSDNSLEIIKSYSDKRLKLINNEKNQGLIKSLNIGLKECTGKYTARIDQDDIALPHRLIKQYEFMENNPDIDLVGSWTECIDPIGKKIKISRNQTKPISIKYEFIFNNVMFHSSIFFKTDLIRKNGGYSEEFIHSEDYEMYSRPGKELTCANIPEILFKLRIHNESITGSDTTQPTVHKNAINISYRNMNQYINIDRDTFNKILDILIIKKPDTKTSFTNFIVALRTLREITRSFIQKNELNKSDTKLIMKNYRGRRKMMWQHYLIGKYRKLFNKNG